MTLRRTHDHRATELQFCGVEMRLAQIRVESAMKFLLIAILAFQLACPAAFAAGNSHKRDVLKITQVLDRVSTAWRVGDRSAWVDEFAEGAYFTVRFELGAKGKEDIAWGHQLVFDNFHADTAFDIGVRQVRFVRPGVALVQLNGFVARDDEGSRTGNYAIPMAVLELREAAWKIIAFQDTPFVVDEYRAYGSLRRFKMISAANAR